MLLQRPKQHSRSVVKLPGEKVADANRHKNWGPASVRAEAQGGFEVADPKFGLPGPQPKPAAPVPALSETRVKGQRAVDQLNREIDVLAEVSKCVSNVRQHARIIRGDLKRPPRKLDSFTSSRDCIMGPSIAGWPGVPSSKPDRVT